MSDFKFEKNKRTFAEASYEGEEIEFRDTAETRNGIFNDLIKARYTDGKSREELAVELNITPAEVKELESTALRAFYTRTTKPKELADGAKDKKYILSA